MQESPVGPCTGAECAARFPSIFRTPVQGGAEPRPPRYGAFRMNARFLKVFGLLLVVAAIGYVAFKPGKIRLIQLPDAPRDAPEPVPTEPAFAFTTMHVVPSFETEADLRRARNGTVEAWAEALEAYRTGKGSLRQAERLEMKVWLIRHEVGEIDKQALHAALAGLLERELVRMEALSKLEKPVVSEAALREARAYLARERLLGGFPNADYETHRTAHQRALEARIKLLRDFEKGAVPAAIDDLDDFNGLCPPIGELDVPKAVGAVADQGS